MSSNRRRDEYVEERQTEIEASVETARGALSVFRHAAGSLRFLERSIDVPVRVAVGRVRCFPRPPFWLLSLILFVILPSLVAQWYFLIGASDQYVAETKFAVRSGREEVQAGAAMSSLSAGGLSVPSLVGQDAHIVVSYIRSRAIIDGISGKIDLRAIFTRPEGDFWARLPSDASIETLTDYWQKMVTANVDGPSGIVTLSVAAFRPDDALALAGVILSVSEDLVNTISDRARRDAMARSETEVKRTEAMVRQALADMRGLRESVGFIDPVATATATAKLITEAMIEKIKLENELFVASRVMSPNAPTLVAANLKLQSVNEQIDRLKGTLTGKNPSDSVVANSLVKFEELELRRIFSEKLYLMAQDDLERARAAAERRNIYISVFVNPRLPESAKFPERWQSAIAVPVTLLIIWGILALTAAAIEDHRI